MTTTPGPWRIGSWIGSCHKMHGGRVGHPGPGGEDGCVYDYKFVEAASSDYYMPGIAGPGSQQMVVDRHYDSLSISWDDAKLIAAAPDMAAALWDVVRGNGQVPLAEIERIRVLLAKSGYVPDRDEKP
jgi:hypothetical protein